MNAAVHRLHFATVRAEGQQIDVYGYLVLAGGHAVLVDTGVGDDSALVEKRFRPRRRSVAEQLAEHGVLLADISTVINSHLHYDHCGNNRLFPNADIVVQSRELEAARRPGDIGQAFEGMERTYIETIARLKFFGARRVCFSHDHRTVKSA